MTEKMKKIYECIISGYKLTTQNLYQMGLSDKDIAELIKSDEIELVKQNEFNLKSLDRFFEYGESFRFSRQYQKARKVYLKCYEIDPTYSKVYFQLFMKSIFDSSKKQMIEYFDKMYHSDIKNKSYKADYNLYLLLLNNIVRVKEEYKEIIQNMKLEDVLLPIDDTRFDDIERQNYIRKLIFDKKIDIALHELEKERKNPFIMVVMLLCGKGMFQIIKEEVFSYIQNHEYEKLVSLLMKEESSRSLNTTNSYLLSLAKVLLEIRRTGEIPEKRKINTQRLFTAIDANDYEQALRLVSNHNQEKHSISDNSFLIILTEINEEIKKIKNQNTKKEEKGNKINEKTCFMTLENRNIGLYVEKKIAELEKEKGIIILDPMSGNLRKIIQDYISGLLNVSSFIIGKGKDKRIVLRYIDRNLNNQDVNFNDERNIAKEASFRGDNDTCIEINLKLLSCEQYYDNKIIYKNLAFAYLKKGDIKRAIDYFIVATELNKKDKKNYTLKDDFSEIIEMLKLEIANGKRVIYSNSIKPYAEVDINEFENVEETDSKIEKLEDIVKLVLEQNISIDEACNQFQMDEEEILIIKLEFARLSYMKGDTIIGDQILKIVEQSEGKSNAVLGLLDDIRRNRNLYAKKSVEDEKIYELAIPHYKKFKK